MKVKTAEIIAVTASLAQYPSDDKKEIAFAGRSNVGKSSLLNLLTGRKKLAKVSSSPGKTRTINFYEINENFRIADLPGYGYAKVSKSVSQSWGKMMEEYFQKRKSLVCVILLVDIRHKPTMQDVEMYEYLKYYGLQGTVVATKSDKISVNQIEKSKKVIRSTLNMEEEERIICISSLKKTGYDELLNEIERLLL